MFEVLTKAASRTCNVAFGPVGWCVARHCRILHYWTSPSATEPVCGVELAEPHDRVAPPVSRHRHCAECEEGRERHEYVERELGATK